MTLVNKLNYLKTKVKLDLYELRDSLFFGGAF